MLQEYFSEITDPRQQVKVKHNLLEIVVMTICAVIAGCEQKSTGIKTWLSGPVFNPLVWCAQGQSAMDKSVKKPNILSLLYLILSDLPTFANAARKHGGIENSLH